VSARYPHNLAGQLPLIERQAGVCDCSWGPLRIRVIVAGQLPQQPHNAALHLFSASSEQLAFGRSSYQRRSERTSRLLDQLFTDYGDEGGLVSYTFEDFAHDYVKKRFKDLTPEERREAIGRLPPEERLAGLSPEEPRRLRERIAAGRPPPPRKRRRKT
jgi:hypothetical protein